MGEISKHKDFHAPDWPEVETTVTGELGTYDEYFDFVAGLGDELLDALGIK